MLLTKDSLSSYRPYEYDIKPWILLAQLKAEREKMLLDKLGSFKDVFDDNKSLDAIYGLLDSEDPFKLSLWKLYVNTENKKRAISNEIAKGVNPVQFSKLILDIKTETKKLLFALAAITARDNLQADYNNNNSNFIYSEIPEKVGYDRIVQNWTPFKISIKNVLDEATKAGKAISGSVTNDEFNAYNQYRINQISERGVKYEDLLKMLANGDFDEVLNNIRSRVGYDKIIDEREKDRLDKIIVSAFMNGFSYKTSSKLTPNGTPSRKTGVQRKSSTTTKITPGNRALENARKAKNNSGAEGGIIKNKFSLGSIMGENDFTNAQEEYVEKEPDKYLALKQAILDEARNDDKGRTLSRITRDVLGKYNLENGLLQEILNNDIGSNNILDYYENEINKGMYSIYSYYDNVKELLNKETRKTIDGILEKGKNFNFNDLCNIYNLAGSKIIEVPKEVLNDLDNAARAIVNIEDLGNTYIKKRNIEDNIISQLKDENVDKTALDRGGWSINDRGQVIFDTLFPIRESVRRGEFPNYLMTNTRYDEKLKKYNKHGELENGEGKKEPLLDKYVRQITSGRSLEEPLVAYNVKGTGGNANLYYPMTSPYNKENGMIMNDIVIYGDPTSPKSGEREVLEVKDINTVPSENFITYLPNEGQANLMSFNLHNAVDFDNPTGIFSGLGLSRVGTATLNFELMVQANTGIIYKDLEKRMNKKGGSIFTKGKAGTGEEYLKTPAEVRKLLFELRDEDTIEVISGKMYKIGDLYRNIYLFSPLIRDKIVDRVELENDKTDLVARRYTFLYDQLQKSGLLKKVGDKEYGIRVKDVNQFFRDYKKNTLEDFGNMYPNLGKSIAFKQVVNLGNTFGKDDKTRNGVTDYLLHKVAQAIIDKLENVQNEGIIVYAKGLNEVYKPILSPDTSTSSGELSIKNDPNDIQSLEKILEKDGLGYNNIADNTSKIYILNLSYIPGLLKIRVNITFGSLKNNGRSGNINSSVYFPLDDLLTKNFSLNDKAEIISNTNSIINRVNKYNYDNSIGKESDLYNRMSLNDILDSKKYIMNKLQDILAELGDLNNNGRSVNPSTESDTSAESGTGDKQ